jgi:hypothetical protein
VVVLWWICRCGRSPVNSTYVLLLSSASKHNMWLGLSLLSSVSKHNVWSYRYHGWVCRCYHSSVNTISGGIMVGFVVVVVLSVNTICGRIMVCLWFLSSVSKHNMWSYDDWFVIVVVRYNHNM